MSLKAFFQLPPQKKIPPKQNLKDKSNIVSGGVALIVCGDASGFIARFSSRCHLMAFAWQIRNLYISKIICFRSSSICGVSVARSPQWRSG